MNFPVLQGVADRHSATPSQVALAWLLHQYQVVVIPKSADPAHIRENHRATEIILTAGDLQEIDRLFPPPSGEQSLGMH